VRILVSALIAAGAAWAMVPGAAQAEGKCSRNADDLKGDMISMMPDGSYCEMDDGDKSKAKADIAAYNAKLSEDGKGGRSYGNGSMFYSKAYRAAKAMCARQSYKVPNCEDQMASSLAASSESSYKRCVERGTAQSVCQTQSESSLDYYGR